jgi:hypothetical protein
MKITADIIAAKSSFDVNADAPTIVHEILRSDLPPAEKEFGRIHAEVSTVSGAAFETSAQTLRVLLYHIYNDANVLRRLRTELQQVPHGSRTNLSVLEQLPYLTAVLMEGLRLSPGIATRIPRVAPDHDLVYEKWVIPKGTPVGMTTLLIHLDGDIYPNPKSFNPERWADIDTRRKYEKIYAPFSRGTRSRWPISLTHISQETVDTLLTHLSTIRSDMSRTQMYAFLQSLSYIPQSVRNQATLYALPSQTTQTIIPKHESPKSTKDTATSSL